MPVQYGKAEPAVVEALRSKLRIPRRFREFLLASDPVDLETVTPAERVRLIPAAKLMDEQRGFALLEDGRTTLFLPEPAPDDPLWHGTVATLDQRRVEMGVDDVVPIGELEASIPAGSRTLAVPDEDRNRLGARLLGTALRYGEDHGDEALVDAVIAMRRAKDAEEVGSDRLMRRATFFAALLLVAEAA